MCAVHEEIMQSNSRDSQTHCDMIQDNCDLQLWKNGGKRTDYWILPTISLLFGK